MRNDLNLHWETELNSATDVNDQWSKINIKIKEAVNNRVPSYQTTEKNLWEKGKIPLTKAARKEIRKNTDAGNGPTRQNIQPK